MPRTTNQQVTIWDINRALLQAWQLLGNCISTQCFAQDLVESSSRVVIELRSGNTSNNYPNYITEIRAEVGIMTSDMQSRNSKIKLMGILKQQEINNTPDEMHTHGIMMADTSSKFTQLVIFSRNGVNSIIWGITASWMINNPTWQQILVIWTKVAIYQCPPLEWKGELYTSITWVCMYFCTLQRQNGIKTLVSS